MKHESDTGSKILEEGNEIAVTLKAELGWDVSQELDKGIQ